MIIFQTADTPAPITAPSASLSVENPLVDQTAIAASKNVTTILTTTVNIVLVCVFIAYPFPRSNREIMFQSPFLNDKNCSIAVSRASCSWSLVLVPISVTSSTGCLVITLDLVTLEVSLPSV